MAMNQNAYFAKKVFILQKRCAMLEAFVQSLLNEQQQQVFRSKIVELDIENTLLEEQAADPDNYG